MRSLRRDSGSPHTRIRSGVSPWDHATERRTHACTAPRSATRSLPVIPEAPMYAPNGVHTFKIFDHGRTQMHHLALDRRNDDEIRQFTRLLVQLLPVSQPQLVLALLLSPTSLQARPSPHPYRGYCTRLYVSCESARRQSLYIFLYQHNLMLKDMSAIVRKCASRLCILFL